MYGKLSGSVKNQKHVKEIINENTDTARQLFIKITW